MIGQILIHVLFGMAVTSTVLYGLAIRKPEGSVYARIARVVFTILALGLVASSSMLVVNIIQHRFEYHYVWNYSSKELPLHLLIACFYSGQEGSFLLWTMLVALIGVFLTPYARRHKYEEPVMMFYGLILTFLTLLLVVKNPFAFYYETFAADGITIADVPLNGRGLNPLLHNAWITIHPPILFTGFASMSVSFAFAMAGLVRKDYHKWISIALPWTLFGTAVLGFGIMLGGFWAYETLGWGGFWGWDPVENSSLIPWLVTVALVHAMLVQKRTHGLVKTNMILAVATFVMVLYSTFLTRSGVLGDTSVHSFVDPGKFAFWILLLFMLTFTTIGVGMVLARRKDMNVNREEFAPTTREFMLSIGSALIMASAIFVTVGTSWPVIMEVIGQPKVAVATDFYNKVHLVLVPMVLIVNALALIVQWRSTPRHLLIRRSVEAAVISAVCTVGMVALGVHEVGQIILSFSAWFSLVVNMRVGWSLITRSSTMAGAYVSHTGIALLIFGVITTSSYTETHHAMLTHGVPTKVGEYTLTYLGKEQIEKHFVDREKLRYDVRIEKDGESRVVAPVLYWSDFNQRQSAFLEPGIRWGVMNDLYVSPKATEREDLFFGTDIQKGATITSPIDSSVNITLDRFTMPMEEGASSDGRMQMAAMLRVAINGTVHDVKALTKIGTGTGGPTFEPVWADVPGTTTSIGLSEIVRNNDDPSKSKGRLQFRDTSKPMRTPREIFTVEFSVKPFISLVWIGVITMVAGFGFSIVRYTRLLKQRPTVVRSKNAPLPNAEVEVVEVKTADPNADQA
ncbi:MAG: cytochrome c biogenesis protein CcsA [Ignavibacteria bacterium]|nr:cytochrome c biogenesis protein CcsA [Ignavibacteria bacterium]